MSFGADNKWGGGTGGGMMYADGTVPGGNTVANTVTETNFASKFTITGNYLAVGDVIRVRLWGIVSTDLTNFGTITIKFKLGSTTIVSTGAVTAVPSLANRGWFAQCDMYVVSIGGSGTVEGQGRAEISSGAAIVLEQDAPNTAAVTVATNSDQDVQASWTWSIANANDTATLRLMTVEIFRP